MERERERGAPPSFRPLQTSSSGDWKTQRIFYVSRPWGVDGRENGAIPCTHRCGNPGDPRAGQCRQLVFVPGARLGPVPPPAFVSAGSPPVPEPKYSNTTAGTTVARGGRDLTDACVQSRSPPTRAGCSQGAAYTVHVGPDRRRMERTADGGRRRRRRVHVGPSTTTRRDGSRLAAFPTHARATSVRARAWPVRPTDRPTGGQDEGVNPTGTWDNSDPVSPSSTTHVQVYQVLYRYWYPRLKGSQRDSHLSLGND
jgi:hypothetical protein